MVVDSSGTRIAVTRPVLICPPGVDSLRESGETLTESVAGSKATTVRMSGAGRGEHPECTKKNEQAKLCNHF